MKKRFLLFGFILSFIFCLACSKVGNKSVKESSQGTISQPNHSKKQGINIEMAIFTNPDSVKFAKSDTHLMDTLVHFLNWTPKGATVYVNIFEFDYEPLIHAMKTAYERGVIMKVMVDNSVDASIRKTRKAIDTLQPILKSPSRLITVHSDANASSIDHHKHMLFSEINLPQGDAYNVVFSTSSNFTNSDTKKGQDAVILTNKGLYDVFVDNWNVMAAKAQSGMKYFTYKPYEFDSINVFFFPRRVNGKWDGKDNILMTLNKLDPSHYEKDTIFLGMNGWTWRRNRITDKLIYLQEHGVEVQVITKSQNGDEVLDKLMELKQTGGYVKILPYPKQNIHSKFMLIKGFWEGAKQKVIMCGTANFSSSALKHNNEVILMLKNSILFGDYEQYFKNLKEI